MAGKRLYDDLDSNNNNDQNFNDKRIKSLPSIASVVAALIKENTLNNFYAALEPVIRKVVSEEVEYSISKSLRPCSRSTSYMIEAPANPPAKKLNLIFGNKLKLPIFTCSKISDEDNNPLEILVVDSNNMSVNLDRPIKIEIVALRGDFPCGERWSSEAFDNNIVKERDGKRPLLAGEVTLTVRNGVGIVGDIEFTDNSSWIRSRKFRIGAKIAKSGNSVLSGQNGQSVAICEAITEAFVVRDHRGELYKKHHPPKLEDEVWRLEKIGKEGAFHKKLSYNNINTVQDFLKLAVVDSDTLRRIMGPLMSDKMWEVTLKHAKECVLGNKFYIFKGSNFVMVFNPVCEIVKAVIDGHIFTNREMMNNLSQNYIKNLVGQAYSKWDLLQVVEGTVNDTTHLLKQGGDEILDQQHYGMNQYDNNVEINRSYEQNGYVGERSFENLDVINEGYITTTTHVELGLQFSINGSTSQNHLNRF